MTDQKPGIEDWPIVSRQRVEEMAMRHRVLELERIGGSNFHVRHCISAYYAGQIASYEELLLQVIKALLVDTNAMRDGLQAALNLSSHPFAVARDGSVSLADVKKEAGLASVENRYADLLDRLGVQGHDGAVAEIEALRVSAGLSSAEEAGRDD